MRAADFLLGDGAVGRELLENGRLISVRRVNGFGPAIRLDTWKEEVTVTAVAQSINAEGEGVGPNDGGY